MRRSAGTQWTTWQDGSTYNAANVPWDEADGQISYSQEACVRLLDIDVYDSIADGGCGATEPFVCERNGIHNIMFFCTHTLEEFKLVKISSNVTRQTRFMNKLRVFFLVHSRQRF